jgi:hypothetical protein
VARQQARGFTGRGRGPHLLDILAGLELPGLDLRVDGQALPEERDEQREHRLASVIRYFADASAFARSTGHRLETGRILNTYRMLCALAYGTRTQRTPE